MDLFERLWKESLVVVAGSWSTPTREILPFGQNDRGGEQGLLVMTAVEDVLTREQNEAGEA
jgi:hypothetical protein